MGAKFTMEQQEVYLKVYDTFVKYGVRFSKGGLKVFFHWIFKYFTGVTHESVLLVEFWDKVGKKLYFLQTEGDFWFGKLYLIFHSIYEVIECLGESSRYVKNSVPQLLPQLWCLPSPVFLSPRPLRTGLEIGTA